MKKYKLINNVSGWIVFLIAAIVYMLTIEPTTSLWDCGEFIASAYKFEVGHPPGAPVFLLLARLFTFFASDPEHVAKMVNMLSAITSAFTILFLFWTITHMAKKFFVKDNKLELPNIVAIIASGAVGALAYTFSDSFWFSAVEGEVYATSSLFTAIVFWAILKWESVAHQKHSDRWIIFICFLLGLSIGIHLLNLLVIPALVFVYYFKKYNVTRSGVIKAIIVSIILLFVLVYGITTGTVTIASWFELLFVNSFGLPYFTGVFVFIILLIGALSFGIYYTIKEKKYIWNTILLSLVAILIGYSSFSIIVIRSIADPPLNENRPDNIFALKRYLNREQYGDRPLLYGQYYNSPPVGVKQGKPNYVKEDGKYKIATVQEKRVYDKRFESIFPRMYSRNDQRHIDAYKQWGGDKGGRPIRMTDNRGNQVSISKPKFTENLRFFFRYQIGHMYFRYFMWNFAGRQNDIQGHGEILNGNWISGIPFIDKARLGEQSELTPSMKNHKSRNVYFMLPLILGILGFLYSYKKGNKDFWVITLLFVLNGLAIIVYLNQYPYQPRERDYSYVASFYAFAIWIGFGVLYLYQWLRKYSKPIIGAGIAGITTLILVPGIMASENWDDHDRSGRYTARDFAYNYLNSCAPNAIVFTNGDNDTFPLWYAQQVEGIRTDVRVCCLPYMITDWFIDQQIRQSYDSPPVPFSLTHDQYKIGVREMIPVVEAFTDYSDVKQLMEIIASDNPTTKRDFYGNGEQMDFLASRKLSLAVDSATVVNNGTVPPEDAHKIVDVIEWELPASTSYLSKSELMILDLIANNNWERPIYFTALGHEATLGLDQYFRHEGFAFRLVPIKNEDYGALNPGSINSNILYDNLMNKFKWGRMNEEDVYLEYYNRRILIIIKIRSTFSRLADVLIEEGKRDSAILVLDKCMELTPHKVLPYDYFVRDVIESYYKAEADDKANIFLREYLGIEINNLRYYLSLSQKFQNNINRDMQRSVGIIQELQRLAGLYGQKELETEIEQELKLLVNMG
ncbi:protein O-mannosyl-transferase family [Bacteroidota bacterium]